MLYTSVPHKSVCMCLCYKKEKNKKNKCHTHAIISLIFHLRCFIFVKLTILIRLTYYMPSSNGIQAFATAFFSFCFPNIHMCDYGEMRTENIHNLQRNANDSHWYKRNQDRTRKKNES